MRAPTPLLRRPSEKTRLLGVSFGMARVAAPSASMKPQVTAVLVSGVLGGSGKIHPIDEFYFGDRRARLLMGRARQRNPALGESGARFPSGWLGPSWMIGWAPSEFMNEKIEVPTCGDFPGLDTRFVL